MLAAMLLTFLHASAYDFEVNGLFYRILSAKDFTCGIAYCPNNTKGHVVIPSEVVFKGKALKVTEIGGGAFTDCSSLTSVEIPNSVTRIDVYAFTDCSSLTSVEIPNSVNVIGLAAFRGCTSLTSVEISNSVKEIDEETFSGCTSLTSVVIPNSVGGIYKFAFSGCTSLTSVVIPNSVKSIGKSAFSGCTSLTSVVIPNSVKSIGKSAFDGCTSLKSCTLSNTLSTIYEGAFKDCAITSVIIPGSVTTIEKYAFTGAPVVTLVLEKSDENKALGSLSYGGGSFSFDAFDYKFIRNLYLRRTCISNSNSSYRFESLELLEIGDNVDARRLIWGADTRNLILGENVDVDDFDGLSKLETIHVKGVRPTCHPEFSNTQYAKTILYVPKGAVEAYKNDETWGVFWNIEEYEVTDGVEEAAAVDTKVECGRYDLYGRRVDENHKGLTIIRYSDGTTQKIITK